MKGPGSENDFAKRSRKMKIRNQMDSKSRAAGADTKVSAQKVQVCSTGPDHKCYGSRALIQKEGNMKLLVTLLNDLFEGTADITALPDQVIAEIRKNINSGAKDLEQKWANALELVNKAYQVSNVRLPLPNQKGAWKQYEDLIKEAVRKLSDARGIDGDWRMGTTVFREAVEPQEEQNIGKRRFFVDVPGAGTAEIRDVKKMDDIIDQITNKLRRHGAKARVEERDKKHVVLSVWVNGVKREEIKVRDVS